MQQNKNDQSIQFCIFDLLLNKMFFFVSGFTLSFYFILNIVGVPLQVVAHSYVMFLMIGLILLSSVTSNLTSGPRLIAAPHNL